MPRPKFAASAGPQHANTCSCNLAAGPNGFQLVNEHGEGVDTIELGRPESPTGSVICRPPDVPDLLLEWKGDDASELPVVVVVERA